MKTYIPDRSEIRRLNLPPVNDEKDSKRTAGFASGFRLRRFIVLFCAAGGLTLAVAGIAAVHKHFRTLNERTAQYESSMADLRDDVRKSTTKVRELEVNLKLIVDERDRLKEMLSRILQQLEKALSTDSSTRKLLEKIMEHLKQLNNVQSQRSQQALQDHELLEKLRREHFEQLVANGEILSGDPAIALQMFSAAREFATANGLPAELATSAAAKLPHAATIPEGSAISVLDVRTEGQQIVADVLVRDASGKFVSGMSRVDFEVQSKNSRLHLVGVSNVERNDRQQCIVVALDNSGSTTGPPHLAMQHGSTEFISLIANPSLIKVYVFDNDARSISPWSIDAALHHAAIRQLTPDGGTALFKGIRLPMEDLLKQSGPRSIVLFADGDNSVLAEDIEKTLATCREHSIVIHVVALKTGDINEPMLQRIASETSGLYLTASDPTRLAEQFRKVAATFLQPAYRIRIYEPVDAHQLTLRVGSLAAVPLTVSKARVSVSAGT